MTESTDLTKKLPDVSIIIPFRDNFEDVNLIKQELDKQTYPKEKVAVYLIDNGSEKEHPFSDFFLDVVTLLYETDHMNSPYSARNRGIEASNGEVIAFIDANSRPDSNWLMEGIQCMMKSGSDLAGGNVKFDFGGKPDASKQVDALTSINNKKSIEDRGAAYTANLFVKKKVFEETGLFEEGVRSGGDVRFTLRAKDAGFSISYCPDAVVWKKARPMKELYRKKIRTGRGYFYSWRKEKEKTLWFYNFFRSLKPPEFNRINREYYERYEEDITEKKFAVWFHVYASGIVEQIAFLTEYLRYNLGSQRDIDRRKKMLEEE
jgi:glycosyltransferase AglE